VAKIKNQKDLFNIVLFILSLIVIYITVFIVKLQNNDDLDFKIAADKYTFFDFVYNIEYLKWSGRITANGLLYFASKIGIWSYRLISPLSILLTSYSISRIFTKNFNFRYFILSIFSFGFIRHRVLGESLFWFTGAFNYLIPVSLGLYALIPYTDYFFWNKREVNSFRIVSAFIAGFIAVLGNEQFSLVMLAFILIFHSLKRKNVPKFFYFLSASIIMELIVSLISPGDRLRWYSELHWLPGFDKMSLIAHILLGSSWIFNSLLNQFIIIFLILSAIPLTFTKLFKKKFKIIYFLYLIQFIFLIVSKLTSIKIFPSIQLLLLITYFSSLFILIIYCSSRRIFDLLCLLAGVGSLIVMWFSPTIFASSDRVMYVTSLLWIIVILDFIYQSKLINNNKFIFIVFLLFISTFLLPLYKPILLNFLSG